MENVSISYSMLLPFSPVLTPFQSGLVFHRIGLSTILYEHLHQQNVRFTFERYS
jgi:hypothetical protein